MDASIATWCSCNEEAQWHFECTNNNNEINMHNNNTYSSKNNTTNSNSNNNSTNITQVTFNQCKANEMRQTHLQRQRELQQTPASHQILNAASNAPTTVQQIATFQQTVNSEKSTHYSPLPQRLARRKQRLQRQKPTELDDVDFAYAADLEEEDEEDDIVVTQQQQQQSSNGAFLGLKRSEQVSTPPPHSFANKCLQHFQQQMHSSTPYDGQALSLPNNAFVTTTTMMSIQQQHLQNQHLQHHYQQHHHQQQQYHLPLHHERRLKHEESFDSSTTTTTNTTDTATSPASPALRRHNFSLLKRGNSTHSDSSSHYSSLDSLLEARKPDPEAILINLGFGPVGSQDILSRIPKRFLKPSQVRGIDTEAFIRRVQLASNLADHSVMGYRGLTGNPDIPPSRIVAKIMHRFEVNERKKSMGSIEQTI